MLALSLKLALQLEFTKGRPNYYYFNATRVFSAESLLRAHNRSNWFVMASVRVLLTVERSPAPAAVSSPRNTRT